MVASLKELMASTIDPAADGIWDSVAVRSTKSGVEYHQPRTPEEWAALRRYTIALIEATNLLVLPGRDAAPPGKRAGAGELEPAELERRIARQRIQFIAFAAALQITAMQTLEAIDRKDTDAVMRAGGNIDEACEACHGTFWYPRQPGIPEEEAVPRRGRATCFYC